jgi:hypothetical protein
VSSGRKNTSYTGKKGLRHEKGVQHRAAAEEAGFRLQSPDDAGYAQCASGGTRRKGCGPAA